MRCDACKDCLRRNIGVLAMKSLGGRGQIVVSPLVPAFPVVSGLRLSYATRGVAVAGVVRNPYLGPSPFAPATFWSPFAIPATRVTVYYNSPAVLTNPPIVVRQPIVVVPERRVEPGEDAEFFRIEPRRGKPPGRDAKPQADRAEPAPMPGMPRGNFRPIEPKDRARAERPGVPKPPPQPGARSAAFVAEGRAAFRAQMYGRAERLFQSAAMAVPAEPTAPFLVAQLTDHRCGHSTVTGSCGCTSHQQCADTHGVGAFCVAIEGGLCTCALA